MELIFKPQRNLHDIVDIFMLIYPKRKVERVQLGRYSEFNFSVGKTEVKFDKSWSRLRDSCGLKS